MSITDIKYNIWKRAHCELVIPQIMDSYKPEEGKSHSGVQRKKGEWNSYPPCPMWDGDLDRPTRSHQSWGSQGTTGSWVQSQEASCGPVGLPHWWLCRPFVWRGCKVTTARQCLSSWFKGSLPSETRTGRKPGRLLVLWTIETDWHFPIKFPVNWQSHKLWFKR